jgi:hypothetical protein
MDAMLNAHRSKPRDKPIQRAPYSQGDAFARGVCTVLYVIGASWLLIASAPSGKTAVDPVAMWMFVYIPFIGMLPQIGVWLVLMLIFHKPDPKPLILVCSVAIGAWFVLVVSAEDGRSANAFDVGLGFLLGASVGMGLCVAARPIGKAILGMLQMVHVLGLNIMAILCMAPLTLFPIGGILLEWATMGRPLNTYAICLAVIAVMAWAWPCPQDRVLRGLLDPSTRQAKPPQTSGKPHQKSTRKPVQNPKD